MHIFLHFPQLSFIESAEIPHFVSSRYWHVSRKIQTFKKKHEWISLQRQVFCFYLNLVHFGTNHIWQAEKNTSKAKLHQFIRSLKMFRFWRESRSSPSLMWCLQHIHTCFKNLGLTWMLALTVGGSGLMGQAGSTELTRTSSAYSFLRGNTSSHVDRNLNRLFLVFSSTYKQRTWLGPQLPTKT